MKRPLVWVAIAMACGAYAGAFGITAGLILPFILCLFGLFVLAAIRTRAVAQPAAVLLVFSGVGALLWEAHHVGPPRDELSRWAARHRNAFVELEGVVHQPDLIVDDRDYASWVLRVDHVRHAGKRLALHGRTHARWYAPRVPLFNQQRVHVRGKLSPELGNVNPGVQDVEDYLRRRGVHTALAVHDPRAVTVVSDSPRWSVSYWASRLRHAEAERLRPVIPESIFPFILAVWLGDRRELTEAEQEHYIFSGVAHILAVSGVHMAILYVSLAFLLKMFWPQRVRLRAVATLAAVFVFALLTGARVSSLRAACMIALYLLADVLDREPDAPTALGLAGIAFIMAAPDALLDVGFLLSFSSVASLLLFREPIENWLIRLTMPDPNRRLVKARPTFRDKLEAFLHSGGGGWTEAIVTGRLVLWGTRGGLSTALAVQIIPLPLAIHFFHVVPLAGPLVNLLVVPLVGVVLWLCLLTTIVAFAAPAIAALFGYALLAPVALIQTLAAAAARAGAYATMTSPTILALVLYWLVALLALALLRRRLAPHYAVGATAGCFAMCALFWSPWRPPAEVVFLDVGHGDATFIRTPDGTTLLVDAGDRTGFVDRGKRTVAPFLWANHVRRLDCLVITHADTDHIGGAAYILNHFAVGKVLLGAVPSGEKYESELLALCERMNIPVRRLQTGEVFTTGGAELTPLHPPVGWPLLPANDTSLVLRLRWPAMDVLLPGDVEHGAEGELARTGCRATVLKAPHHASYTSSSEAFLDAVAPRLAVASGSDHSARGMHGVVLERYRRRGIPVLRTDIHGAITLRVRAGNIHAQGERTRRGYVR